MGSNAFHASPPYALLLIDNQRGLNHPTYYGTTRSNPSFEKNITLLLSVFRSLSDSAFWAAETPPIIIHVAHHSTNPLSPLHPSNDDGVKFFTYLTPDTDGGEVVITKSENSAFIGTDLETRLRDAGIRTLVVGGLTTDHCVSSTVRMAANLHVVDRLDCRGNVVEKGRILLAGDATACWEKGKWDAETVHGVTLASLDGEFAEVFTSDEVVTLLGL
jgi:nicotinamidase-related amidase